MQHDVDIISSKEISIFNNNNSGNNNNNFSEVLIYNFETDKYTSYYKNELQKENFKTGSQGLSQILNDKSLFVEEQNYGRLLFFNKFGKKEWEFVNKDKKGDVYFLSWSRLIEDQEFINNFKLAVNQKKCTN